MPARRGGQRGRFHCRCHQIENSDQQQIQLLFPVEYGKKYFLQDEVRQDKRRVEQIHQEQIDVCRRQELIQSRADLRRCLRQFSDTLSVDPVIICDQYLLAHETMTAEAFESVFAEET